MALFSCASSRSKCMRYLRLRCQKLSFCFEHTHFVDLLVILGKRAQPLNIYNRGTMAKLIEACVPFCVCVRTHMSENPQPPFFPLPIVKDYLDLLCRRAYVPSWLTCINFLCMVCSETDAHAHCTVWLCRAFTLHGCLTQHLYVCTGKCTRTFEPADGWTEPSLWD